MPAIDTSTVDTPAVNTPAVDSPLSMEMTWQRPRMPTSLNEGRGKERWRWWCQLAWLDLKWVFAMGTTAWRGDLRLRVVVGMRRGDVAVSNWIVTWVTGVIISHTSLN